MYLEFFGFRGKPFTITPNPRFIFLSKNHKEVFAHLLYGIRNRSGFIEVTGEVGAGKTTVLRTLFEQLEGDDYRLAFIFNPSLSAEDLLRSICRELHISLPEAGTGTLLEALNSYLLQQNTAGRTVVLVIDEAQNLAPEVLEQIRLLSNLETESDKLIQIVLVGQPELGALLDRPDLRQLNQRVTVRYHLLPMGFEDTRAYIRHRLQLAGCPEQELFTDRAIRAVYGFSRGLPRLINILCDRALLVAYSEDRSRVDRDSVAQARRELGRSEEPSAGGRRRWRWGLALLLLVAAAYLAWPPLAMVPEPPATATATATVVADNPPAAPSPPPSLAVEQSAGADPVVADQDQAAGPVAASEPPAALLAEMRAALAGLDENGSAATAVSALLDCWHLTPLHGERLTIPGQLRQVLGSHDLLASRFHGSVATLVSLDAPVLLDLILPGVPGHRYLAILGRTGNRFSVAPAVAGRTTLDRAELKALWSGYGWVIWRNYARLNYVNTLDAQGPAVERLQAQLARAGLLKGPASGHYDLATVQAVTRLQARRGLVQDGRVGPQTLVVLYQEAPGFAPPRLAGAEGGAP